MATSGDRAARITLLAHDTASLPSGAANRRDRAWAGVRVSSFPARGRFQRLLAEPAATPAPSAGHVCPHCGTPLQEGQQWCLHCGACEPGSLGERPNLRPLTVLALTAAILALGAAVAVAAAINEHGAAPHSNTVALVPATTPTTALPHHARAHGDDARHGRRDEPPQLLQRLQPAVPTPSSTTKPPKVTAPTPTPKASGESGSAGESSGSSKSSGSGSGSHDDAVENHHHRNRHLDDRIEKSKEGSSGKGEQPTPILLDTNAATTYNPYNYPNPASAIPGWRSTGNPRPRGRRRCRRTPSPTWRRGC